MDYRSQLLTLASTFAAARGLSEARVATLVQNSGSFFDRIRNGATCTVDVYLRVQQWFADQWPEGIEWPAGVDRPGVLPLSRQINPPPRRRPDTRRPWGG
jgi:hypothetical protein